MKTSSNTFDVPESKTQKITGHDQNDNISSEKASSYFLKEHENNQISSNPIFNLKKKLTLLITIAVALAAFLMTACEDEPEFCSNCTYPNPAPNPNPRTDQIEIRSIHPYTGAPGSTVTIVLENFSSSTSDQYVSFGPSIAEIIYARYGMMTVRVPMDLKDGDYPVSVRSNGQVARAPHEFKVIGSTNRP